MLGRRTMRSRGKGPGFRLNGSREPGSLVGFGRLLFLLAPGEPTRSMSASSTYIKKLFPLQLLQDIYRPSFFCRS